MLCFACIGPSAMEVVPSKTFGFPIVGIQTTSGNHVIGFIRGPPPVGAIISMAITYVLSRPPTPALFKV